MKEKKFINYAHRGASHYAPENTLLAFYTGIFMGANGIETDVQKTKDGVLVLFHDDTLDRVTGKSGSISDYTFMELQNFDVQKDNFSDKIVKFEDFLKKFAFRDITFAIELKFSGYEKEVSNLIFKYHLEEKAIVTSFCFECLENMNKVAPSIKTGFLTRCEDDETFKKMKKANVCEYCPEAQMLTKEKVEKRHASGFNVRAWGVYDEDLMKKAYEAGVDGMTVNFPDKLNSYINR